MEQNIPTPTPSQGIKATDYQSLMQRRIRKILLVCNSYDGYTLEEDGRIESQINQEYNELNLSNPPLIKRAVSTVDALNELDRNDDFDLIITMYNVGELDVFSFSKLVKQRYPAIPVVLLTYFSKAIYKKIDSEDRSAIDYIFCWHGSADLIIAIIKIIEDRMNADHDILEVGVQAILLVEDSIRYYSTYLPTIYRLILQQTRESMLEALNEQQMVMRKRARPKILLATNYNEAVELYQKYKENLLGVISDVGFVIDKNDPSQNEKFDAGIDLCRLIKHDNPLMPFLLQSSQESMREVAQRLGVGFIVKYSKTLLLELSDYISSEFAFGDFVFRDPARGTICGRAKKLSQLQSLIAEIPDDILTFHTSQNHLSKWMFSRGLFWLGRTFKKIQTKHFDNVESMRQYIIGKINDYRTFSGQGIVASFDAQTYNDAIWFARMGNGSMGGKARGLAFINSMLHKFDFYDKFAGVRIMIPRTAVITTDYFDSFIRDNGLQYVIKSDISDEEILSEFASSRLPQELVDNLKAFVRTARGPIAVRSSSKLEDSYYQPFAGIYSTYMIPMVDNEDQMLRLLGKAIKSVYASVYYASSRAYITATSNLISEEKMAVVIQEVCGSEQDGYFMPTLSGVARSINFYPIGDERPEDGVVKLAFGLGKAVVDGEQVLSFSPKYPKKILQLSTPELALKETQRSLYALDLKPEKFKTSLDDGVNFARFGVNEVQNFRNLRYVASTWDMQNQTIVDSALPAGRKVITFAHILKYDTFPLAQIISQLLEMGSREMGCSVEIEFAANLDVPQGGQKLFNMLQIRPIANETARVAMDWNGVDTSTAIIYCENAIGAGEIHEVRDIIYVRLNNFDSSQTAQIAQEIGRLNSDMKDDNSEYVLVGPGRWGSSDPWLGIPVRWEQISQAKVIVECGMKNYHIEPSQGTHFFQNLTSFGVGYLTINPHIGEGLFAIERLDSMPATYESKFVRRVHFDQPLNIFVDGINNKAIVGPPDSAEA